MLCRPLNTASAERLVPLAMSCAAAWRYIFRQFSNTLYIVRHNCRAIIKDVVNCHYRNITFYQFNYLIFCKIYICNHNAVNITVTTMLQI